MTDEEKKAASATALAQAKDHFANYAEYNKLLRTWLVTFGLGGPVLFFTKPELLQSMSLSDKSMIIWTFLAGCAAQVFGGFLNKVIAWQTYSCAAITAEHPERKGTAWDGFCEWVSKQFWIDISVDGLSIGLFTLAVFKLTSVALKA
jgi:hypothetical protein